MHPSRLGRALARASVWAVVAAAFSWQVTLADEPSTEGAPSEVAAADLPELEAFVDGVVGEYLTPRKIAGAQVAVVKDGRVLLLKGYGIDSIDPVRSVDPRRSLFRIGSISKTFTWLSLMQLVERGELDLTDPINDHLPDELDIADEGFEQPIRIVDLMNHTAGFEEVLQHLFVAPGRPLLPLQEQLGAYRPQRVRAPGSFMAYSNYSTALAGAIVAQISGTDFESYVERNILTPLGMSMTTFREEYVAAAGLPQPMAPDLAQHRAQSLEWRDGAWKSYPYEHLVSMAPAGSAVSTAEDMARYMMALLDPQRLESSGVLKQSTLARMREPTFQGAPGMPAMHHGFFNAALGANTRLQFDNLSHGGATLHFMSLMIVIPDLSPRPQMDESGATMSTAVGQGTLGIFVTTNSKPGGALNQAVSEGILAKYYGNAATEDATQSADPARLAQYAGEYRSLRRSYSKFEKVVSLASTSPVTITADGQLQVTTNGDTALYVEVGPDLFRKINGDPTIAFARDEAGRVTHLITTSGTLERIGFFQSARWLMLIVTAGVMTSLGIVVLAVIRWRRTAAVAAMAESIGERRSAQIMLGVAIAWLAFGAAIVVWAAPLIGADGQDLFLLGYPQRSLKVALAVLLVAAGLTLLAVASLVPVWRESNWSVGRRLRHSIAAAILSALVVTLMHWNVVGFKYL